MKTHSPILALDAHCAAEKLLRQLYDLAVGYAAPEQCLPEHLPLPPSGRTFVVAIGKAAAAMAQTVEQHWPEDTKLEGHALTRYGHGCELKRIKLTEASHPVPDNRGYEISKQILLDVEKLTNDDLLLFLVSGGGSALFTVPAADISLDEKKQINKALLMSGAPIGHMNIVRKHISATKGGRLAKLAKPAKITTLAISDVPGDDPSTIASGPTVPDKTTSRIALDLLESYNIEISDTVHDFLDSPLSETPKPGDPVFDGNEFRMVCTPAHMLEQVEKKCKSSSLETISLGANIEGEARTVAADHATLVQTKLDDNWHGVILSGGETTVTVSDNDTPGRGGRNCEYLLALAIALNGRPGVHALAADTDGIDGSEDTAGAIISPDTLSRGEKLGLDPHDFLKRHDSYSYFEKLGDLIITGPTRTNVNDFRAIIIEEKSD